VDAGRDVIHATAIAVAGRAVLIRGPSGSGKSDLALRCLAQPPSPMWKDGPALLVSDDQVALELTDGILYAHAPAAIAGLIEVRGLGIYRVPPAGRTAVTLVADLTDAQQIPRLPAQTEHELLLGAPIPRIRISPNQPSAHLKLLIALAASNSVSN
jgi:HPr kinase/phosphorylase